MKGLMKVVLGSSGVDGSGLTNRDLVLLFDGGRPGLKQALLGDS